MRGSLVNYGIFILASFLIWHFWRQGLRLIEAEETIQLQHEAILKQNEYLEAQKRYIYLLELQSAPPKNHINPKFL